MPAPTSEELPPCQACGACCFADRPHYVRVDGADYARLGDDAERVTVWHENRAYLRMIDGHCAALERDESARAFTCAIYARRPMVCRELARGAGPCLEDRARKGARALAILRR